MAVYVIPLELFLFSFVFASMQEARGHLEQEKDYPIVKFLALQCVQMYVYCEYKMPESLVLICHTFQLVKVF